MPTYHKNDPHTIQSMFNSIAKHYDKANSILSFQLHKKWNRQLVCQMLLPYSHRFLDLCCGTGDIAFDYLQRSQSSCRAYLLDFSSNMLSCAKGKAAVLNLKRHEIKYLEADAQNLPLSSNSIDCATLAYGIRNIKDPDRCLQEIYRVLKPGGRFGILELTQPKNPFLRFGHRLYLKAFLPVFGKWITANQDAYQYLCNSIQSFILPEELENKMRSYQFIETSCIKLTGGIATILIGQKPLESACKASTRTLQTPS